MNANEKNGFVEVMSGIAELYGKKLSPELLEVYWRALDQYPFPEVNRALNMHVLNPDNGQFMPKPADIARLIHGETQVQALRAWTKVISAIRAVGAYDSIVFDDAIIHIVIEEMQGWIPLCQSKEEKLPFIANEFQKRYCAYLIHKPHVYPRKLIGIFDYQGIISSTRNSEPLLFGDQKLAKLIYDTGKETALNNQVHKLTNLDNSEEKSHDEKQLSIRSKDGTVDDTKN